VRPRSARRSRPRARRARRRRSRGPAPSSATRAVDRRVAARGDRAGPLRRPGVAHRRRADRVARRRTGARGHRARAGADVEYDRGVDRHARSPARGVWLRWARSSYVRQRGVGKDQGDPRHFPGRLRLGGERRGEETASYRPDERTSVHKNPRMTADLGGTERGGQRVEGTPAGRRGVDYDLGVGVKNPSGRPLLVPPTRADQASGLPPGCSSVPR
jgi:hypothetical protein